MPVMRRALPLLVSLALVAGCGSDDPPKRDDDVAVDRLIKVPDFSKLDGAAAVAAVKQKGFEVVLDDPGTDPAGCAVVNQDPPAGASAAPNAEVTLTLDCDQSDWEAQKGDTWEAFATSYARGFDAGCERLFADVGVLASVDGEFRVEDCKKLAPDDAGDATTIPADRPTNPKGAGRKAGIADGCGAIFEAEAIPELADAAGEAHTAAACIDAGSSSPEDDLCRKTGVSVEAGDVACGQAAAVYAEYERNAAKEGVGPSAALMIDEWQCEAARADVVRCENSGGDAFTVKP
jgi:hypothetical protein